MHIYIYIYISCVAKPSCNYVTECSKSQNTNPFNQQKVLGLGCSNMKQK